MTQEFIRFLSHESTGAKSFTSMPSEWPEIAAKIHAGGAVKQSAEEVKDVVGAWHQELRDLSLILTRQLKTEVKVRIQRKHVADPLLRLKDDVATLCRENRLEACFQIPAAAAPLDLVADVKARSITTSMRLRAPEDRKSTKARLDTSIYPCSRLSQLKSLQGSDAGVNRGVQLIERVRTVSSDVSAACSLVCRSLDPAPTCRSSRTAAIAALCASMFLPRWGAWTSWRSMCVWPHFLPVSAMALSSCRD